MKKTRILMGMPVIIEITDSAPTEKIEKTIEEGFDLFNEIDERFSPYKNNSELMKINRGEIQSSLYSTDMKTVFSLAKKAKEKTHGYFDIYTRDGSTDPSGLVKGWAIERVADILEKNGYRNFIVEAGGDIQTKGKNKEGEYWKIGIRNPFNASHIIKVVSGEDIAVATSGTYIRGQHIYNPHKKEEIISDIVSMTVISKNIFDSDIYATASFAMGKEGINFLENLNLIEGYMVDSKGIATLTTGFSQYIQ